MPPRLDLFIFGPDADAAAARLPVLPLWDVRLIPIAGLSRADLTAGQLNPAWAQAPPADVVGFADSTFSDLTLTRLIEPADSTAGIVLTGSSDNALDDLAVWQSLPAPLASLVHEPDPAVAMFWGRPALERVSPLRDVSAPLWDGLIRAAALGVPIRTDFPEDAARVSSGYREEVARAWPRLTPEAPAANRDWLRAHLLKAKPESAGTPVQSRADGIAVQAGLLQIHDYLDDSHKLAQGIEGRGWHRAGDYWHAIIHRREQDFSNSRYWFRNVGRHPIFADVARHARQILAACSDSRAGEWESKLITGDEWNPRGFVELCEACREAEETPLGLAARAIQAIEMDLLLVSSYADAIAASS